ncbi:MAG: helix-turn-helix domain-containing protein [Candidatus Scalindua sp.]
MITKKMSHTEMSSKLFEFGLALQLGKITTKEIEKHIPLTKFRAIASQIEEKNAHEIWDDSNITSGEKLRAALNIHGISQAELAKKLSVRNQKINDLMNGRITLTVTWAKKIGEALNVSYKNFV